MLYWKANFQIPNSGAQAAEVYVDAVAENNLITANFYAESEKINLLITKTYENDTKLDALDYLLTLDEFSLYSRA